MSDEYGIPRGMRDTAIRERLLQVAKNFVQAYTSAQQLDDERRKYTGVDPRNYTGERFHDRKR